MSNGADIAFKILDRFKPSPHTVAVVFVVSTAILFTPSNWLVLAHVIEFRSHYFTIFALVFFTSGVWLLLYPFLASDAWLHRTIAKSAMKDRLKKLATDEKTMLRVFAEQNMSTAQFPGIHAAPAGSLSASKIIFSAPPLDRWADQGLYYFRIEPWILEYLKKHPRLLA